jgi:hypothetical protein
LRLADRIVTGEEVAVALVNLHLERVERSDRRIAEREFLPLVDQERCRIELLDVLGGCELLIRPRAGAHHLAIPPATHSAACPPAASHSAHLGRGEGGNEYREYGGENQRTKRSEAHGVESLLN